MDGYAGELERARALFELGIGQALLDMPELLWKAYIDFEIAEGEAERARQLYERLLERTQHVKVLISAAHPRACMHAFTHTHTHTHMHTYMHVCTCVLIGVHQRGAV